MAKRYDRNRVPAGSVVITGTGLGLPGAGREVMSPDNAERLLRGESCFDGVPENLRSAILDKRITRLVKDAEGNGSFVTLEDIDDVLRLAGLPGRFDLHEEYGVPRDRIEALDITSQLAMAAGIDALREAGVPLTLSFKRTSTGKFLPQRWMLPESLRDETGVIFASIFPGLDRFHDELRRYYTWKGRGEQVRMLDECLEAIQDPASRRPLKHRREALRATMEREAYQFDRRFLFRVLAMGHSQVAEYLGARGPNAQVNIACASTTQALALAEDWIHTGRCRRVLVVGADNVTGDNMLEWIGSGFQSVGAAAVDGRVEDAALPFDRRRHGLLLGMGACAFLVESEDAARERGVRGIVEIVGTEQRNSAFHGTRLDPPHIASVMGDLLSSTERRFGLDREAMAPSTVYVSHETYTPARGGSASAEVTALRQTFGPAADRVVVTNTKGYTGHPMGVGIEDVIAVKILEHGIVPPIANFREPDPELGPLRLSRGGPYPVQYAMHMAAGFGSQLAIALFSKIPGPTDRVDDRARYRQWLSDVSGYQSVETEVVRRTLRIKASQPPARSPAACTWVSGTGPSLRAAGLEDPPAEDVLARVTTIVAEKAGYPAEMLAPEMELEADLGICTAEQAEAFSQIREAFSIPPPDDLRLGGYPTIESLARFVEESRPV